MKKSLVIIICLLFSLGSAWAKSLNSDQLELRQNIVNFLKEEGYMPDIDSDGDIRFKSEGKNYYVIISESSASPMFLTLYLGYNFSEARTRTKLEAATSEINKYKGLKFSVGEKSYSFKVEMYLMNAEHFRYTFYKHMEIIGDANREASDVINAN